MFILASFLTTDSTNNKGLSAFLRKIQLGNCLFGGQDKQSPSDLSSQQHSTITMIFYFILKTLGKSLESLALIFESASKRAPKRLFLTPEESSRLTDEFLSLLFRIKHTASVERISSGLATLQGVFFRLARPEFLIQTEQIVDYVFSFIEKPLFDNILKRSAAVPFLLVALLKIEPKGNGGRLLQKCLSRLLFLAKKVVLSSGEDAQSEEAIVSCVHSLNALKFIFFDSRLKSKVVDSLEVVLRLSIKGFSHLTWSVRNSALMLYTAVVRSSLKIKRENQGELISVFFCSQLTGRIRGPIDQYQPVFRSVPGYDPVLHERARVLPRA